MREVSGSCPIRQSTYIGVVTYEAMTSQCKRSVVQVLVVRLDIGVAIYEAIETSVGDQWFRSWLSEWIQEWRFRKLWNQVWEVSGSGPGCQSGYRSGDL